MNINHLLEDKSINAVQKREEIKKILRNAARIDSKNSLFGAESHRYVLNTPIDVTVIRTAEEKYGFTLPDDYFRFITEIGDGGAGLDYGIRPFTNFFEIGKEDYAKEYYEAYRCGVAKPFAPRPMMDGEVTNYAFTKKAYENNPDKFFVFEKYCEKDDENIACNDGFFVLGTHGCQWDFGIITAGDRRGQIFDTDNEGAYFFLASSFNEFYQRWLDKISDEDVFKKEIKTLRKRRKRKKKI